MRCVARGACCAPACPPCQDLYNGTTALPTTAADGVLTHTGKDLPITPQTNVMDRSFHSNSAHPCSNYCSMERPTLPCHRYEQSSTTHITRSAADVKSHARTPPASDPSSRMMQISPRSTAGHTHRWRATDHERGPESDRQPTTLAAG